APSPMHRKRTLCFEGFTAIRNATQENQMRILRWEPFGEIDSVFNRLMPSMFSGLPIRTAGVNGDNLQWAPSADISETNREFVIRAELPTVKKEDVKVTVDDGMLTIEGDRKQKKEDENEKIHRSRAFTGTSSVASRFHRASMKAQSTARARTASSLC